MNKINSTEHENSTKPPIVAMPCCDLCSPDGWTETHDHICYMEFENFTLMVFHVVKQLWEWRLIRNEKDHRRTLLFSGQLIGKKNAIQALHICFTENYHRYK